MRTRLGLRHPRDEQGAVAILTAFLMVGLILCAAIVVDLGNARDVRRQSQNAADAAALAGANVLYPATAKCPSGAAKPCITEAVAAVKSYAASNFQVSDWALPPCRLADAAVPLSYVPDSSNKCISLDSLTSPTLVRVYIPTRTAPTFFGGLAQSSPILVGSSAQASLRKAVTCTLCVLGNVDAGNGDFNVNGGSVAVDGWVKAGPTSFWNTAGNSVHGVQDVQKPGNFTPPLTSIPWFDDPLAGLAFPSTIGLLNKTNPCSGPPTGGPGLYGAFNLPNTTCNLQPGLYVISGKWLAGNNTILTGTGGGVTLYAKSPSGELDFKNGNAIFRAPTAAEATTSGGLAGYAIIYDRDNGSPLGLQGNGSTMITGAAYAKASTLDGNGNSCFGFTGGPVVVKGIYSNGTTGCLNIINAADQPVLAQDLHLNQ